MGTAMTNAKKPKWSWSKHLAECTEDEHRRIREVLRRGREHLRDLKENGEPQDKPWRWDGNAKVWVAGPEWRKKPVPSPAVLPNGRINHSSEAWVLVGLDYGDPVKFW